MNVATVSGVVIRRGLGLRSLGFAVILMAIGLLALAVILPSISPLRVDPIVYGTSAVVGIVLGLAIIRVGRNPKLPMLIDVAKPTSRQPY